MISDIIRDKLTQNPPIIPLNPPVSSANAANNFWKVRRQLVAGTGNCLFLFSRTFLHIMSKSTSCRLLLKPSAPFGDLKPFFGGPLTTKKFNSPA